MSKKNDKNENPESKTTRDVNAATRATLALELRRQRLSYEEIAVQAGYASKGAAFNAIQREMQRVIVKDVALLRAEEIDMLNKLHGECWKLAMDVDYKGRLFAVDRVLVISEARRKLLNLDIRPDDILSGTTIIRQYNVDIGEV